MSDEYRNRSDAGYKAGDIEWRRDADRRWDTDGPRGDRGRPEPRAFQDRETAQGRPDAERRPQHHRGYRLGPYGRQVDFSAPDYVEPGGGYGGALYDNASPERDYGDDRYSYESRRPPAQGQGYGQSYARTDDGRRAFQGDNERLQRVSDGNADQGHLFGGGTDGHRGRGPKGYSRSDTRIHDDVADHLTADPYLDASEIDVAVKDGEVTLSGHVFRREDRRRAEDLVEHVLGVKHVQNNLRVQAGATSGAAGKDALR